MDRSDSELVAACRRGDEDAWQELVLRYQRLIYTIPIRAGWMPRQPRRYSSMCSSCFTNRCRRSTAPIGFRLAGDHGKTGNHTAGAQGSKSPRTGEHRGGRSAGDAGGSASAGRGTAAARRGTHGAGCAGADGRTLPEAADHALFPRLRLPTRKLPLPSRFRRAVSAPPEHAAWRSSASGCWRAVSETQLQGTHLVPLPWRCHDSAVYFCGRSALCLDVSTLNPRPGGN